MNSSSAADAIQKPDAIIRGPDSNISLFPDIEEVDMKLSIKDGGIALLFALVPDCEWLGGQAAVDVRVHGSYLAPSIEGKASMSKGQLLSQHLRYPVSNLFASVKVSVSFPRKLRPIDFLYFHMSCCFRYPNPATYHVNSAFHIEEGK
jgi:hypothetical protein